MSELSKEYYEAYDERYKQVHSKSLRWFSDANSKIVEEVMKRHGITEDMKCLEIGCGEGRDAVYLLSKGYNILATDISSAAVQYCKRNYPARAGCFHKLNCLMDRINDAYDFIYAVSVLHMLVLDIDRFRFYRFLHEQLKDKGIALICTIGDGEEEWNSDISTAFALQKRIHEASGKELLIAGTSCRAVSFKTISREITDNGLTMLESGITSIKPDFPVVMYAVVGRGSTGRGLRR
jgi:cyclopropane fatty-acyl-phospholipid synthase-like methyltransferase